MRGARNAKFWDLSLLVLNDGSDEDGERIRASEALRAWLHQISLRWSPGARLQLIVGGAMASDLPSGQRRVLPGDALRLHFVERGARDSQRSTPLLKLFRDKERERNAEIAEVLDETLTRLASRGVEAIALKGAAFLASGSACSRPMIDIDLLVRPRDKDKAFEALNERRVSRCQLTTIGTKL